MRTIVLFILAAVLSGCGEIPMVPVAPCGTTVVRKTEGTPPNVTTTTVYYANNYCQQFYPATGYYFYYHHR